MITRDTYQEIGMMMFSINDGVEPTPRERELLLIESELALLRAENAIMRTKLIARTHDCARVRAALLDVVREHPLTRDVDSEFLRVGHVAESAAKLITWYAAELERARRLATLDSVDVTIEENSDD